MKCPHCNTSINVEWFDDTFPCENNRGVKQDGFSILYGFCPECENLIIKLLHGKKCVHEDFTGIDFVLQNKDREDIIYPKFPNTKTLSQYIPEKYAQVYKESEQVNNISPRASATLSRYLLQMILHEELKISKKNLAEEIEELETKSNVPTELITMLQVMRKVANFGAHPKKSTNSNEIIDVEKGESDVMLELINQLFDFVFVRPKMQQKYLDDIKAKYGIETEKMLEK